MRTREYYLELLSKNIKNQKMIAHCLASEAVLRALAKRFNENEDAWGFAGLLHDIDVEFTEGDSMRHGPEGANLLKTEGLPDDVIDAILMHNEMATGKERETLFQHALAAGETITGLIFATALVYPDKKIGSVKTKSIVKRMKEKAFAASVNRDTIMECEKIGIPINEFAELSLEALKPIEEELGF
ncbi:MAG: HDIG domain-containing protein [Bacteroidales bacterium]|jgi:putative nucleotidyltransferase with HDIG domain|nr:HDIG domain-containing protein [Bacteroidales bacterium]MDD4384698.1 HDIG domain-containing protein [Bacteroidales bacterium]MDY0196192.1 HDIG domain-containing protein [Tenuifilaceae bacterium]